MLRKLPPRLLFSAPFSACLSFGAGWKLIKNSLPQLFSAPPSPAPSRNIPLPNLVLVVHGIGPQEKGEDGGEFSLNVKSLESLTLRALLARAGGYSSSNVVFRPVFWRTSFRSRISCDEQIALCALPSLPRYRAFFSTAILDVFYYTSRALHASMLKECVHQLNHEYLQHCKQHPRFAIEGGCVTIIGHSLGSVIMFDLLSHHKDSLLFHPQCLICMGSPLGMFLPLQQELHTFRQHFRPFAPTQPAPAAAAAVAVAAASASSSFSDNYAYERIPIVNLFHPNDPVASRLEPLLEPSAALIPPASCMHSSKANNSMPLEHTDIMKLMAHVRSLALQRMPDINWADVLAAGQTSSARLMRLLESSALNQLRLAIGKGIDRCDGAEIQQHQDREGVFSRQQLLMQYIVVSNLHQSLTDFIQRHNDSHSARLARSVFKAMWQRLEDLKLQLRSSSGGDGSSTIEAGELILQSGLSAAAAVLQNAESHDAEHLKQKQQILEQQRLQSSLPHLHLQLELYAADAAAPMLSLDHEAEIMAAAQQGRYSALARVANAADVHGDSDAERLQLADAVVGRMRVFTSLCGSVRAVTATELLQLMQLRRLPPTLISHSMRRLDPLECGFINASAVRDFFCACSIVRASAAESLHTRVHLLERTAYVLFLQRIQDDIAVLQSPGAGGWRQLDDARSKKPFWHNFSTGISSWSAPHAVGGRETDTAASGDTTTSPAASHRGRIDFTTECEADAGGGKGGSSPSLADEARDYIESIHAHSRYWTDLATSNLVAEVLLAVQQQRRQQQQHEEDAVNGAGIIDSSNNQQQLLAFWLRVMPTAESLAGNRL